MHKPMENKKEKFTINSYVVFKIGQEHYEGRIKDCSGSGNSEIFTIYNFTNFKEHKVSSNEILCNVSQEIKRKMKTTPFIELPDTIHFPPELKSVLIVDKEWSCKNTYELPVKITVSMILNSFYDFLINQAHICEFDEAGEIRRGFLDSFNFFFKMLLIYENEQKIVQKFKTNPSEYCGAVHLLRLIYFLQKEVKFYINDQQTKNMILDYTVYLLDFLMTKFKEYF